MPAGRIVRQLLAVSVLLALLGGVGLVLAHFNVELFDASPSPTLEAALDRVHLRPASCWVLPSRVTLLSLTGIVFGLAPALQVSRTSMNDVLKEGGRGNAGAVRAGAG